VRGVKSHDLSGKTPDALATFDSPPHPEYFQYGTNDHDLVSLSDGTVLYLTGAFTKRPLSPQPVWWKYAYRGAFGPGARTNLMVWQSIDCGKSFQFVSEMDPAQIAGGTCANPQPASLDSKGNPMTDSLGHYNMGGTDGQLIKVDPSNNRIYLTFQCVGYYYTKDNSGNMTLTTPLNKTLVALSSDKGASWQSLGYIDVAAWRFGILPLNGSLAFGFGNKIIFGSPSFKQYAFGDAQVLSGRYGGFNWNPFPFNPNPNPDPNVSSNVWANTVIARAGESNGILFAYPSIIGKDANATNGYSLFFHDSREGGTYVEISPIVPLTRSSSDFVMDVTAIDIGKGPVLLYWMDVNSATHVARMRGRVIVSVGQYSSDFDISSDIDLTLPANYYPKIPGKPAFFYGDYHTASGYEGRSLNIGPKLNVGPKDVYRFYPIWVDRTGGTRYAVVTVSEAAHLGDSNMESKPLATATVPSGRWRSTPPAVKVIDLKGELPQVRQVNETQLPAGPRPKRTPNP
jgi:hypothetical protein